MSDYCTNCAFRLYNKKYYKISGIGDPLSGNCIIVPNVDYPAYKKGDMGFSKQVEDICSSFISSTGVLQSDLYILPLIRCNEQISCKLDDKTYKNCLSWFKEDIIKYDFKNILLLGSAATRFLNIPITDNLDYSFISKNNRRYFVNYSPFIKYIDNNKFEIFKSYLVKWYNAIRYNDFSEYKTYKIV